MFVSQRNEGLFPIKVNFWTLLIQTKLDFLEGELVDTSQTFFNAYFFTMTMDISSVHKNHQNISSSTFKGNCRSFFFLSNMGTCSNVAQGFMGLRKKICYLAPIFSFSLFQYKMMKIHLSLRLLQKKHLGQGMWKTLSDFWKFLLFLLHFFSETRNFFWFWFFYSFKIPRIKFYFEVLEWSICFAHFVFLVPFAIMRKFSVIVLVLLFVVKFKRYAEGLDTSRTM